MFVFLREKISNYHYCDYILNEKYIQMNTNKISFGSEVFFFFFESLLKFEKMVNFEHEKNHVSSM